MECAAALGKTELQEALAGSCGDHAHDASFLVFTDESLVEELNKRGHRKSAFFIFTVGQAWQAWKRPNLTHMERTSALERLRILLYRIVGGVS